MRRKTIVPALAAAALCTLATPGLRAQVMTAAPSVSKAIAVLHATKSGGEAHGEVTFTKVQDGVHVEGEVRGLTPGDHGFHRVHGVGRHIVA